ncbi:hypothetical protein FRC02_005097 [Tulasnella sp. 418]|nr:hypothetical protein FRC02_005097 [Tulasnella sp. 418]
MDSILASLTIYELNKQRILAHENQNESVQSIQSCQKHSIYYEPTGRVKVQVQNICFRVSHLLLKKHSSFFANALSSREEKHKAAKAAKQALLTPVAEGHLSSPLSTQEENDNMQQEVIVLTGVIPHDFEAVMHLIYDGLDGFTPEQWRGVLWVAVLYCFSHQEEAAINWLNFISSSTSTRALFPWSAPTSSTSNLANDDFYINFAYNLTYIKIGIIKAQIHGLHSKFILKAPDLTNKHIVQCNAVFSGVDSNNRYCTREWKVLWQAGTLHFLIQPRQFDGYAIMNMIKGAVDGLQGNIPDESLACLKSQCTHLMEKEALWKKEAAILEEGINDIIKSTKGEGSTRDSDEEMA